jgi:uncharacterized membrane protein YgdD (TMEM256/DUF423 family)
MYKVYIRIGAILGALAVLFGAFGAHYLKSILGDTAVKTFNTGVEYQFYHSLALLLTGLLISSTPSNGLKWAGRLFIGGIILFSGSLYLLTILKATGDVGITPLGGLLVVGGWISLALGISGYTHKHRDNK